MKKEIYAFVLSAIFLSLCLLFTSCDEKPQTDAKKDKDTHHTTKTELTPEQKTSNLIAERLRRFDSLDFNFYSNQQWDSLAKSHANNIRVYYPDGSITEGLFPEHIDRLKPLFEFAPDTKITTHPIKFGENDWTAVIGEIQGTFSKPMPVGNGRTIQPTGKKFKLRMCTIGKWEGGKMVEEHLFWDNQALMKQIGAAQ